MASLILDNGGPSTTEVPASFVEAYVQERLGPSWFGSVILHSFTPLNFPPQRRTVHFTIDYPLEIAFIHPTSDPR
jgi:hypothetical protein